MLPVSTAAVPSLNLTTALQNAIESQTDAKVKQLIKDNPALINIQLPNGKPPLHFAISLRHFDIARTLITSGADIVQKDSHQIDAVEHAAIVNDKEFGKVLLKTIGIRVPATIRTEIKNIWHKWTSFNHFMHAQRSNWDKDDFLRHISFSNNKLPNNELPLEYAIKTNDLEELLRFCHWGADLRTKLENDETYLHLAVKNNLTEISILLMLRGLNPNDKDSQGNTPLSIAIQNRNLTLAYLLLACDAIMSDEQADQLFKIAQQQDPLAISSMDKWIFFSTIALWLAKAYANEESYIPSVLGCINTMLTSATIVSEMKHSWKKGAALASLAVVENYIPHFNVALTGWKFWNAAKSAFNSLNAAYTHFYDRPWQSICKVAIDTTYTAHSIIKFATTIKDEWLGYEYEFLWSKKEKARRVFDVLCSASLKENVDDLENITKQYKKCLLRYDPDKSDSPEEKSVLQNKSAFLKIAYESITNYYKNVNLKDAKQNLLKFCGISVDDKGKLKDVKKDWRVCMLRYHPDKTKTEEKATILINAFESVENYFNFKNLMQQQSPKKPAPSSSSFIIPQSSIHSNSTTC